MEIVYNEILMNQGLSNLGLQLNKPIIEEQKGIKEILYKQDDNNLKHLKEIEEQQKILIQLQM